LGANKALRLKEKTMIRLFVMSLALAFAQAGHAGDPRATLQVQVADSSLYIRAAGTGLVEGTHQIRYAVFDANGKEITTHTTDVTADSSGKWRNRLRRGLRPTDALGTWWVTLEVAGQPVASSSVNVVNAN
jgi:hypothetical protein